MTHEENGGKLSLCVSVSSTILIFMAIVSVLSMAVP